MGHQLGHELHISILDINMRGWLLVMQYMVTTLAVIDDEPGRIELNTDFQLGLFYSIYGKARTVNTLNCILTIYNQQKS